MEKFDYAPMAELYPSKGFARSAVGYRRFESVAQALQYAIEEMPSELLKGCRLEVDELRFEGSQLRELYDAADYPLTRRSSSSS